MMHVCMMFACVSRMCMYSLLFTWEEIAGSGRIMESLFKRRMEESGDTGDAPFSLLHLLKTPFYF